MRKWTEEEAKEARPEPETDRDCARVMDSLRKIDEGEWHWCEPGGQGYVGASRSPIHIPRAFQVSRRAQGAKRARDWLRTQTVEGRLIHIQMRDHRDGERLLVQVGASIEDGHGKRPVAFVVAPNENIATARLLLLLAAMGFVGGGDDE